MRRLSWMLWVLVPMLSLGQGISEETFLVPYVVDAGGVATSAGDYVMHSSIGQAVIGEASAASWESAAGFFQRLRLVVNHFELGTEGWVSGAFPDLYDPPSFASAEGKLSLQAPNLNCFGFWESEFIIPILADKFYRFDYFVTSPHSFPDNPPRVRPRQHVDGFAQAMVMEIPSVSHEYGSSSPDPEGKHYLMYFVPSPALAAAGRTLMMQAVDIINIAEVVDGFPGSSFALEHVTVEVDDIDTALQNVEEVIRYTFDSDAEGWTTATVPQEGLRPPVFAFEPGSLTMTTSDTLVPRYEFGCWCNNPDDITVEADKLYMVEISLRTDEPDQNSVPWVRFRVYSEDSHFHSGMSVYTYLAAPYAPDFGLKTAVDTVYTSYFLPPDYVAGTPFAGLGLAFDLCNVGTDSIPSGVRVMLNEVAVKKADIPSFNQF